MTTSAGPVWAVLVTYNRKELLEESLRALSAQERPPDRILVVDNASDDGTDAVLAAAGPAIEVLRLPVNVGGAGGFSAGIGCAARAGAGWVWLMDDDTIPDPGALAALLDAAAEMPGAAVLASRVRWLDGSPHLMNQPGLRRVGPDDAVAAAAHGLVPIRSASFVSVLVSGAEIARHGLPHAHYFIWADDLEYTARILRDGRGYLVPASTVLHKTAGNAGTSESTGPRFAFAVRNWLLMLRGDAWAPIELPSLAKDFVVMILRFLRRNRCSRESLLTVARGIGSGIRDPVDGPPRTLGGDPA